MSVPYIKLHYDIAMGDFLKAGEASSNIKKALMKLGIKNDIIRRVCIVCYEAEMNIVIHSLGGYMDINIYQDKIEVIAKDNGPGIKDIDLAMTEGYSTAPDVAREMGFGAGMGLPNMKKSSDIFQISSISDVSTTIRMIIAF
jgi:serine/threonine-protein kinase RsbT